MRAEAYTEATKQDLHYIIAQDKACAAVLHEKAELATEKLAWLQHHDRECGDLCGVLPLCRGMPVYLTEYVNRKRLLLKGRNGRIVNWKQASQRCEHINDAGLRIFPERTMALQRSKAWGLSDHALQQDMVLRPETQGEGAHVESFTLATSAPAGIRNDCTSSSRSNLGRRCNRRLGPGQTKQPIDRIYRRDARHRSVRSVDYAPVLGGAVPARGQQLSRVYSEALARGTPRLANHSSNLLQGQDLQ